MSKKIVDLDLLELIFAKYENGMSLENIVDVVDIDISPGHLRYMYNKYLTNGIQSFIRNSQNNKYTLQFKKNVVQEYLNDGISYKNLAIKYNISAHETVRRWVNRYTGRKENINSSPKNEVYTMKGKKTTFQERLKIVEYYLDNEINYKDCAEKYGISYGQLYQWVQKYKVHGRDGLQDGRGKGKPKSILTPEEQKEAEIQALKSRNKILEMENKVLKKYQEIGKRDDKPKNKQIVAYETIETLKNEFPIKHLCQILKISRASFYKWLHRNPTQKEIENQVLLEEIKHIYKKYKGIYGYRRIYIYIRLYLQKEVNHKRVYRLMNQLNLKAVIRRKRKRYKPSNPQTIAENELNRKFQESKANKKWLTDVTELQLKNGNKIYLSAIYDLGSGKIVSHVLGSSNNNQLVFETFDKAVNTVTDTEGIIFHSDRGFQYTSRLFKNKLNQHNMIQSMSRVGRCIDNGPMEGVWGIIKSEIYRGYKNFKFETIEQAFQVINEYITFFNNERITLKMANLV
ncbi:IS3 family transposase [Staphylococcus saprophyticus]|nr:IS3 family transposase [Staphylococcus saprophyticus]MCE5132285.1 IS3 family transposase [Staphylococcus saprophyticus]